ncbi:MAG: FtsX-like permease family protein [Clostridiales bacterium]|nr:FtsX-like permease family protein [Clostridiales bacterium]
MFRKKMFRDIIASKAQFISIFILAFLGVFIYSGMRAEWEGMRVQVDSYYSKTALADSFLYGADFNSDALAEVRALPGVQNAQLRLELDVIANLPDEPTLRLLISDENLVSRPLVTEGAAFDPKGDGLWLDERFAREHELSLGDELSLSYESLSFSLPIHGFIFHPEFVHNVRDNTQLIPDPSLFGYACVPASTLPVPGGLPFSQILVTVDEAADAVDLAALTGNLEAVPGTFHVMPRKDHPSVSMFEAEINQNRSMATLFPILFFFVAALSMLTTMTRLVLSQRTLIGTFMGLGFSRRRILFHYVSYGLWIGLFGGILGLLGGPPFMAALLYSFQRVFYSLPVWRPEVSVISVLSVAAAVVVCVGASLLACVRELREMPAEALRPKPPRAGKHTSIEKTRVWHRLSFISKWNIRDILRQRVRSTMAIAGVLGCTMMLVWGIGIYDSMNRAMEWFFEDLQFYSKKVYVEENFSDPGIFGPESKVQAVDERAISVKAGDMRQILGARIFASGDLVRFEDVSGNELSLPDDGAIISKKTAENLDLAVGDTVSFRILGLDKEYRVLIRAIHRTPFEQGFVFSKNAFESLGLTMHPTVYLLSDEAVVEGTAAGVSEIQDKAFLEKSFDRMLEGINLIVWALFAAAVLLGLVVLYNLGSLSFAERTRELATLRVLGYPLSNIKKLLRRQTVILTAIGSIIGVPCGFFFVRLITETVSDNVDFPMYISPLSVALCVLGTFAVSLLVDAILTRRTAKIDMVSALKSVE